MNKILKISASICLFFIVLLLWIRTTDKIHYEFRDSIQEGKSKTIITIPNRKYKTPFRIIIELKRNPLP